MATSPKPNPKGLYCPSCKGHRLTVVSSSRPCPGRKIRYRKCSACGDRLKTVEVMVRYTEPAPAAAAKRAAPKAA